MSSGIRVCVVCKRATCVEIILTRNSETAKFIEPHRFQDQQLQCIRNGLDRVFEHPRGSLSYMLWSLSVCSWEFQHLSSPEANYTTCETHKGQTFRTIMLPNHWPTHIYNIPRRASLTDYFIPARHVTRSPSRHEQIKHLTQPLLSFYPECHHSSTSEYSKQRGLTTLCISWS